ncbi:putative PurR-regulated permease PerM [Orbus hercynius]|uniref:Putative PurR-regulated permease PerM n=1 Tax=Orbus hercynius TaxID=593135 RepID=A0A495RHZ9_9GAMM|nr:AI-2E family transporter YdiK [Orbus hercynius]RKS87055.1 putative PurR-regulated permease PerM [Orbus hercynius]
MPIEKNNDLLKLILNLIIMGLFIIITYRVIEPFLFGFFWAVMVVITTWPLMIQLQHKLFNRRLLAVLVMTIILSLFFIIPFMLIIMSITKNSGFLLDLAKNLSQQSLPSFDWLARIPLIGNELYTKWQEVINNDGSELVKEIQPYFGTVVSWMIEQLTNISVFVFHCAVMIVFSALLFLKGEDVKKYVYHFAYKLSKQHGENTITLAGKSIRAVALGVVVTAVTLTLIGGLSLAITSMPFTGFLTLLLFLCCVVQIGPTLIMAICTIWQFWDGHLVSGFILLTVTIILTTLDSIMRIYLIKKGVDLPFLLILFGVIGGLLGFGAMGLFIGPVILALSYNIIHAWIEEQD